MTVFESGLECLANSMMQENKSLEAALKAEESLAEALRERLSVLGEQVLFWAYLFCFGHIYSIFETRMNNRLRALAPCTMNPKPCTRNPKPQPLDPEL